MSLVISRDGLQVLRSGLVDELTLAYKRQVLLEVLMGDHIILLSRVNFIIISSKCHNGSLRLFHS